MTWNTKQQPFGVNRAPILTGLASDGSGVDVPVAVDPVTGAILTEGGGGGGGNVTITSPIGQKTMANSVSVAIASDQSTVPVADLTAESYLSDIQQTTEPSGHSGGFARVIGIGGVTGGGVTDVVHIDGNNNLLTASQITDGTNTANVVAGDTGFSGVATNAGTRTYTFSTSASGAQVLLANTQSEGFAYVTVIATSVGSGLAWGGQFAPNSGGTYVTTTRWSNNNSFGQSGAAIGTSVNTYYISPVVSNFFQLNVTALTSGTLSGFVIFSNAPLSTEITGVTQVGAFSVGANSSTGQATPGTAFLSGMADTTNLVPLRTRAFAGSTGATGASILAVGAYVNNGTSSDMAVSGTAANNTTGAGLLGAAELAVAATALPTAASATNYTTVMSDKFGRQVVLPNAQRDLVLPMTQLTLTATTTETTLISQVASTFLDIVSLVVVNTSATATQVDFRDSTAGTIRLSLYVPAGDMRGVALPTPLPQNTVNNNWTAKCGTSVSSVIITGTYITNK